MHMGRLQDLKGDGGGMHIISSICMSRVEVDA